MIEELTLISPSNYFFIKTNRPNVYTLRLFIEVTFYLDFTILLINNEILFSDTKKRVKIEHFKMYCDFLKTNNMKIFKQLCSIFDNNKYMLCISNTYKHFYIMKKEGKVRVKLIICNLGSVYCEIPAEYRQKFNSLYNEMTDENQKTYKYIVTLTSDDEIYNTLLSSVDAEVMIGRIIKLIEDYI